MNDISDIFEKVRTGTRLNAAEGMRLFDHPNLLEVGRLANEANRQHNEDKVFYNVNRHINPTNVCVKSCKFCAFSRKPGEPGAYEYSIEEVLEKAATVVEQGATEVHMVGGLHPRWRFQHFLDMLSALHTTYPQLHIKAFTAVEIDWLAAKARLSLKDTLLSLKEAGLGSMPGGGAEIFHPEIRDQICDTKTDAGRWLEIHRTAHSIGLRSNCTMLYGHIEKPEHRVDHMLRLRELQDETNGFNVFIPLAFQPYDNELGKNRYTAGADDLRTLAVSRLLLDNFQHIKAYWIMLGQDIAQLALNFGANDLDGTVTEEKISRMAGGRAGMVMNKSSIASVIRKAHRLPVERDTLYNSLHQDEPLQKKTDANTNTSLLLYKREKGEALSTEEMLALAENADLLSLGECARDLSKTNSSQTKLAVAIDPIEAAELCKMTSDEISAYVETFTSGSLDMRRATLPVDLSDQTELRGFRLDTLASSIDKTKELFPELSITLRGFKGILNLANILGEPVETVVETFSQSGLDMVESSHNESENGLTDSEIFQLHEQCHAVDINTIAKVEISAPYSGPEAPFWEAFYKRLQGFVSLNKKTKGILGIKIEADQESFITPCEYLRAIALARIVADDIEHILAPFGSLPTIKPRPTDDVGTVKDAALKIAPLTVFFGASDLGLVSLSPASPFTLMDEINLSGLQPQLRNAKFDAVNLL